VLESFYEVERDRVAERMRAASALRSIKTLDRASLLRAFEVYEVDRWDFAEGVPRGAGVVMQGSDSGRRVVGRTARRRWHPRPGPSGRGSPANVRPPIGFEREARGK
jgi:hypothetical protein